MARTLVLVVGAAALLPLWYLFTGTLDLNETIVGIPAVMITTAILLGVQLRHFTHFKPRAAWFSPLLKLPWQVLKDSATVAGALLKRSARDPGEFSRASFPAAGHTSEDAARRTLAVWLTSLPPNSFVVVFEPEENVVVYHELVPQGKPPDPIEKLRSE
jgi:hypothetical protein